MLEKNNIEVKSKYAIPIELKELDELLEFNHSEPIWEQKVNSKMGVVNLITQLVFAGVFIYHFQDVFNILLSLILVIPTCFVLYVSSTMKYSVFPNNITFEWGLFSGKKVVIPFSDITAINLVQYEDSDFSTIYFGTNKKYKIRKLDFDKDESRVHITFENVKKGVKVNELLCFLWQRSKERST